VKESTRGSENLAGVDPSEQPVPEPQYKEATCDVHDQLALALWLDDGGACGLVGDDER
jgi:hypothetical protein